MYSLLIEAGDPMLFNPLTLLKSEHEANFRSGYLARNFKSPTPDFLGSMSDFLLTSLDIQDAVAHPKQCPPASVHKPKYDCGVTDLGLS